MTLTQLKYFQTLAYILHYTRASELLHISQPSLSHAIAELEKELGFKLFERVDRQFRLTEQGQTFLPFVEKSMDLLLEGVEKSKALNKKDDLVRLGYFHSISTDVIPNIVNGVYKTLSSQKISFSFKQLMSRPTLNMIKEGKLDLGFTSFFDDEVEGVPVLNQDLYLVVNNDHPLAQQENLSTKDIINEPMIVLDRSTNLRKRIEHIFEKVNAVPAVAFEVEDPQTILQFVARGIGVAILPLLPAISAIPVKYIKINDSSYSRKIYLIWAKDKELSPAAALVKQYILENYK